MLSTAINLPTRRSYVYENSRYNPVLGFSSRGLLPTDHKALSNRDGTDGYSSLEEASEVLLSKGWSWDVDSKWEVELQLPDVDAEGYSYSTDFQHFSGDDTPDAVMTCGGAATKTMMHFVRRRRLARNQCFDVNMIIDTSNFTCDHCDLQEVEKLARLFLDKLTAATINRHPRNICERKINLLKNEMMDICRSVGTMRPYAYTKVSESLDVFISSCRTTLSMASSVFIFNDATEHWAHRQQDIARYFVTEERLEWAKLMIRNHDVECSYHCNVRNCGPSCIFAIEACPNIGCCVYYSRKWAEQHDTVCPEKVLPCTRTCGNQCKRKHMSTHLQNDCILRPIDCPYKQLGCEHELVFKDLEEHLHFHTQAHMDLMFRRLIEQQSVIQSMHHHIQSLQASRQQLQQDVVGLTTAVAAATAATKASEARQDKLLREEIQRVDNKHSRQISNLQSDVSHIRTLMPRSK